LISSTVGLGSSLTRNERAAYSTRLVFERAMKIDPQSAEAMVGLALARYTASVLGWSTAAEDTYAAELDRVTKATAINPGYAFAHYVKSLVLFHMQLPEAIEAGRMAVSLDPNAAYGYFALGHAEGALGRCRNRMNTSNRPSF